MLRIIKVIFQQIGKFLSNSEMVHVQATKVLHHLVGMTVEALVLKKKNAIREHRQKIFVRLSGFWPLRGCDCLSEFVKKGKFETKIFFSDNDE